MLVWQKDNIIGITDILSEAHGEVRSFLSKGDAETVSALLGECRNCVSEAADGVTDEAVCAALKEYREALSRTEKGENADLDGKLENLRGSVLNAKIKKEIVFMPYKADMWDALESIWIAASRDDDCEVFVVPVPWYDLVDGKELGTMHCDADKFPKYVPVTDYKNYDIELRRPDIIYIINPYDEHNHVARLESKYYSYNLKQHCKTLCYTPYFVGYKVLNRDFSGVSAAIHADVVVSQSEVAKEAYISYLTELYGARNTEIIPSVFDKKFAVLGSPKVDKILNGKTSDFDIPGDWEKLIINPDGTRKKVLFFNSSLTTMYQFTLDDDDNIITLYLDKLSEVLEILSRRDDIAVLWRPHPLMDTSFTAIRPPLANKYRDIVSKYKSDGFGIYDDSAEPHRALVLADAYIGDHSSLLIVYAFTGKPIYIFDYKQSSRSLDEQAKEMLSSDIPQFGQEVLKPEEVRIKYPNWYKSAENWLKNQKYIFTAEYGLAKSTFFNAVYNADTQSGKAELLVKFPDENYNGGLYQAPLKIGNKLIFVPQFSRRWAFYGLDSGEWTYEQVPEKYYPEKENQTLFGGRILFDDCVLILPGRNEAFAKYNIETGEITYHDEWFKDFGYKDKIDGTAWQLFLNVLVYGKEIALTMPNTNIIVFFDPTDMKVTKTRTAGPKDCVLLNTAAFVNNVYSIAKRSNISGEQDEIIIKWDMKSDEYTLIDNLPVNYPENYTADAALPALNRIIIFKSALYIIPMRSDSILKLDPASDTVTRFPLTPEFDFFERKYECYNWAKDNALPSVYYDVEKMTFLAVLPYDYSLADIDLEKGTVSNRRKIRVAGVEEQAEEIYRTRRAVWDCIIFENMYMPLTGFADGVVSGKIPAVNRGQIEYYGEYSVNHDGTAGQKIHEYVKNFKREENTAQ